MKLPKYFRKDASVKTIEITGRGWFDKVNGNSYCSVRVIVNQGLKNEFSFKIPFTYGYGNYYEQTAFEHLAKFGAISNWHLPMDTKIKVFSHISKNCLKREVIEWGK